jgi:hypothetical protein
LAGKDEGRRAVLKTLPHSVAGRTQRANGKKKERQTRKVGYKYRAQEGAEHLAGSASQSELEHGVLT